MNEHHWKLLAELSAEYGGNLGAHFLGFHHRATSDKGHLSTPDAVERTNAIGDLLVALGRSMQDRQAGA